MTSLQNIRKDLKEIQYYYSKKKLFDESVQSVSMSAILEKVHRYNLAVKEAPPKLYDLYISLYTQNNTQEALAYEWDCSEDTICRLNKKLCVFLGEFFDKGGKA